MSAPRYLHPLGDFYACYFGFSHISNDRPSAPQSATLLSSRQPTAADSPHLTNKCCKVLGRMCMRYFCITWKHRDSSSVWFHWNIRNVCVITYVLCEPKFFYASTQSTHYLLDTGVANVSPLDTHVVYRDNMRDMRSTVRLILESMLIFFLVNNANGWIA